MKNLLIAIVLLMSVSLVQAEDWIDFDNKTYVGGYYATVCYACVAGRYNNDVGYWSCTNAEKAYTKGCAKGILNAILGRAEVTLR